MGRELDLGPLSPACPAACFAGPDRCMSPGLMCSQTATASIRSTTRDPERFLQRPSRPRLPVSARWTREAETGPPSWLAGTRFASCCCFRRRWGLMFQVRRGVRPAPRSLACCPCITVMPLAYTGGSCVRGPPGCQLKPSILARPQCARHSPSQRCHAAMRSPALILT